MALVPGTRLGPYEVLAQIGVGGMGEVYRATDTNLNRPVAIKVLPESVASDPERLARFDREAKTLASLNHPGIAQIYGVEKQRGQIALVMELVEGPTLADRIAQGAIPVDEALPIARQIAEALEAAHEQGIIHRDLKPANIKVRQDGTVKVLDFGLAKAMDPVGSSVSPGASQLPTITTPAMTQAGIILGTAAYMSPEQARGKTVDRRADIWAFGAVLFEMLTGQRAFPGDDLADTLASVVKLEPQWEALGADVPARVRQALRACLQKDPKQRMGDMQSVRLALDGAFDAPPVLAARTMRSTPWAWVAAAAVGVLLVGGLLGAALARNSRREAPPAAIARVSMLLPADGPIYFGGTGRATVAISPDGRTVAYTAAESDGSIVSLRVRALDSLETRRLPGTEQAVQPFFSPDGRWVAFFTGENELKKVALTGGAPITLARGLGGGLFSFGTWTDDDQIVFGTVRGRSPLWRVAADGGTPAPLTTVDASIGESSHELPEHIPGTRTVLFTVLLQGGGSRIDAVNLDTRERRSVVDNGSRTRFVQPDHLLFQRGDTVLVAAFDPVRLALTGPPQPLAEAIRRDGAGNDGDVAQLAVSGGGTLAFVPDIDPLQRVVLVGRDGDAEPLNIPPARYQRLAVSPDGASVALEVRRRDGTGSEILLYDRMRGTTTNLTLDGSDTSPSWRRDGRALAVTHSEGQERGLFVKDVTGGGRLIMPFDASGSIARNISWHPDGRQLAYTKQLAGAYAIWVVNVDEGTRSARPLLAGPDNAYGPRFSPDGRWMAYTAGASASTREIYVRRYPDGASLPVSSRGGDGAVWQRDGKALFYQTTAGARQMVMAVSVTAVGETLKLGTPTPLFAMRSFDEAGNPRAYRMSNNAGAAWDVLPDGRFVMLQGPDTSANREIVVVEHWSNELQRLAPTD